MEANGIVLSPDPRLRQECAVIEEITPAIEALAEKMKKMMFENGGCGLAAPGDLFCVCLQHEIDHLHGNTMFERLKPMQRIKAVKEYQDALARGARPGETE